MELNRMDIQNQLTDAIRQIINIDDISTMKMRHKIVDYIEGDIEDFISFIYDCHEIDMVEMGIEEQRIINDEKDDEVTWN